jgi:glycosyltransferase involved in cell wall biosynthesis
MLPLVSCICPTMESRRDFLPRAIQCFLDQDYPYTELIIVADSILDAAIVARPRVRALWANRLSLGEKRNVGCLSALGQVICHFDDDDFSRRDRISHQVDALESSGKAVIGYYSLVFQETRKVRVLTEAGWRPGAEWWRFTSRDRHACGTSLCFRREWWRDHPFEDIAGGEDDRFYSEALAAGEALAVDGGDRMFATNHGGGVSGRLIGGAEWEELAEDPFLCH